VRIGLFGMFGCGNSGNDGSLEAMVSLLQRLAPQAEITCICPAPEIVRARLGIAAISPSDHAGEKVIFGRFPGAPSRYFASSLAMLRNARRFEVIIVPGTGFFDDFNDGPMGWPLHVLRWMLASRIAGATVIMESVGAGPIHNRASRWLTAAAARLARSRSYRDAYSRSFVKELGIDVTGDRIYPDLAFRLPVPLPPKELRQGNLTIGIGMMNYHGWKRNADGNSSVFTTYIARMAELTAWLLAGGYDIRLVTGDVGDWPAIEALQSRLKQCHPGADRLRIQAEPSSSLGDLMDQLAQTDVVVATRFHNVVCALKLMKPTISLGYAPKNQALLDEMGMAGFSQHIDRFDLDRLKSDVQRVISHRAEYVARITEALARYDSRIADQDRALTALLDNVAGQRPAAVRA